MERVTVDSIVSMYAQWGAENYDEHVSQSAHALQCAALAARDRADETLIVAALLHDIGHLFEIQRHNRPDHDNDLQHEVVGSRFLAELFPPAVTDPIALHVDAKRHLAGREPAYFASLSDGSQRSLHVQGGPFSEVESMRFLNASGSEEAIRLRRWDDHGKVLDLEVPEFSSWIPLLKRVAIS